MSEKINRRIPGQFVVSLDFELMWGVKDHKTIKNYGSRILGARGVIPQLLDLFEEYRIHVTWAIVGFLFADSKKTLKKYVPISIPKYENPKLCGYTYLSDIGENEENDPYHYAFSLIELIRRYKNQEIATHTFSHYYCKEKGQTKEDFLADLRSAKDIAREIGNTNIQSIVFPRNQCNREYINALKEEAIVCYRGLDKNFLNERAFPENLKRMLRLIDTYINLVGNNCYPINEIKENDIYNIRASRFFRPYFPKLRFLESMKLRRIKQQMKYAAENGLVFHLWWHPHNFGRYCDINMEQLKDILDYYKILKEQYGFENSNMIELVKKLN